MLITLEQFKARYLPQVSDQSHDLMIEQIITDVGGLLAGAAGMAGLELWLRTELLSPGFRERTITLAHRPIVQIASVVEAWDGDFEGDDATELIEGEGFKVDRAAGMLTRLAGFWLAGNGTVAVTGMLGWTVCPAWEAGSDYSAGQVVHYDGLVYQAADDVAGVTPPPDDPNNWDLLANQVALPDDIAAAALQQAGYIYQRRDALGLTSTSAGGGSSSAYAEDDLLPIVAKTMRRYHRDM